MVIIMMNNKCNELFRELSWYTDEPDIMHRFVDCMKTWVEDWNKGNIKICLIDLHEIDESFAQEELYVAYNSLDSNNLYIAYDDMGGAMTTTIYSTHKFVEYIIDIFNEYAEDLMPEEYWIYALDTILHN